MLSPEIKEEICGNVEVQQVFNISKPGEQPVELVIGQSHGTLHHDGPLLPGSWGFSSTPMIPHGGGPSSYHLPKMTQDTPRITFLNAGGPP